MATESSMESSNSHVIYRKQETQVKTTFYTVLCYQKERVFAMMSPLITFTWYPGMQTEFRPNI